MVGNALVFSMVTHIYYLPTSNTVCEEGNALVLSMVIQVNYSAAISLSVHVTRGLENVTWGNLFQPHLIGVKGGGDYCKKEH